LTRLADCRIWVKKGLFTESFSPDGCSSMASVSCQVNGVAVQESGTLQQVSPDGISGNIQFSDTSSSGDWQGQYTITYARQ